MKSALIAALLAFPMAAQPKPADVKPPVVSDGLKAQFFKAQSQLVQAQSMQQQRQESFQQVINQIQAACGGAFQVQLDSQGDPACAAKPVPPEKKAK